MTRLLFIYPLFEKRQQPFRYAQTARRLFNEKVDVYLVESGNLEEMINKVMLLEHSELLYDRLSLNAYKLAQQWYPPNTCRALANLFLGGKMKCTYRTGLGATADRQAI